MSNKEKIEKIFYSSIGSKHIHEGIIPKSV